jgi:hypothetical protein
MDIGQCAVLKIGSEIKIEYCIFYFFNPLPHPMIHLHPHLAHTPTLELTASLILLFFSWKNIIVSLTSLTKRERCNILWSLWVSQFARLAICKFKSQISQQNRRTKVIFEMALGYESGDQVGSICEKTRGWKSRETITLEEPQFSFKLCKIQNSCKILARLQS